MVSLNRSPNGAYTLAVSMRVTRNHGGSVCIQAASTGCPESRAGTKGRCGSQGCFRGAGAGGPVCRSGFAVVSGDAHGHRQSVCAVGRAVEADHPDREPFADQHGLDHGREIWWYQRIRFYQERYQIAEALRRSETKFRTLYDSTSDAVMLLDEKGFFDCNPAALAMFGCATREEFCSKHPADVSPPVQPDGTDSRTLANQQIATAMEKGATNSSGCTSGPTPARFPRRGAAQCHGTGWQTGASGGCPRHHRAQTGGGGTAKFPRAVFFPGGKHAAKRLPQGPRRAFPVRQ